MGENSTDTLIALINNAPDPVLFVADNGECLFANPAFLKLLGIKRVPKSISEFWPSGLDTITRPGKTTSSLRILGGKVIDVRVQIDILCPGVVLVTVQGQGDASQVTGLPNSERLEALGMLAGGVAHDFNNVLTGILGHVSYLKTILPRTGSHVESLTAIEEGAKKASGMTQQILNFSKHRPEEKPVHIDLCRLTQSTLKLLKGAVPSGCVIECKVPELALQVLAVESRLTQILINLVVNARDAVAPVGKIKVQLESVNNSDELTSAFHGSDLSSSTYAKLTVIDNGHGMTEEVRRRMFEPYFSTKKALGTGLGLATVYQTVKQFGGAITVESEVGVGTRISVYLPAVETVRIGEQNQRTAPELTGGKERVLIVDDEYPVRNVLCVSLEHLGYDVEVASGGVEAIDKFKNSKATFDLVILDMIMPQMGGDKVFVQLKNLNPAVKVLVISGYSSEAAVQSILDNGGLGFMAKPFTIEELSRKVRDCLNIKR